MSSKGHVTPEEEEEEEEEVGEREANNNLTGKTLGKLRSFFTGSEIPWVDHNTVLHYKSLVDTLERQEGSDSMKNMYLPLYKWALVHSKEPNDVQLGMDMVEGLADYPHLYLSAVGYFRKGDYKKSMDFADRCLMVKPESKGPLILKKLVERRLKKGGVTGIAVPVVVAVTVTLVAVALWRRK